MIDLCNRRTLLASGVGGALVASLPDLASAQGGPLPPAAKPADWAKAEATRFARISPNGKRICYMTEKDAIKYLYTFDIATEQAQVITMGTSNVSSIDWVDDTHIQVTGLLAARYATFSRTKGQLMLATIFNVAKGTQNALYSAMPDFYPAVFDVPTRIRFEGKTQVIALAQKKDTSDDYVYLYRFDLDGNNSWVMDHALNATNWIVTPEGEMVARSCYHYEKRRWSLDYRKNGSWKEIYHYDVELDFPDVICLAGDGESLIVSIPSGGEINDIHQISPDGVLSPPLVEHGSNRYPTVDPITYRHNGFTRYDGWMHYEYTDPVKADIARKAQLAMGEYRMRLVDSGDNPQQTIVYSEGIDDAGTYYYIDFATKKPFEIGRCYPDIPVEWVTSKQLITYKAADGLDIPAYLTLPPNRAAKNLPLVVFPHTGPASSDGFELEWIVQALASAGYAVLQPNYRGSTRYGESFIAAGNGEWAGKMLSDMSDGVAFLVSQGSVDAKRVSIFGMSGYAGYAALASVSLRSGIYNCAISHAGITDLDLYRLVNLGNETSPSYLYFRRLVGEKADLKAMSPTYNTSAVNVPILLIHSEEETSVDIQQSRKMSSALKSSGKAHEFINFKAEDNWHLEEKSRVEFINYVVNFLSKHSPA